MPLLETPDMIDEYWETIKDKYPNLTQRKVEVMVRGCFEFFRTCMGLPSMPIINIKYLGKLKVFPAKYRSLLKIIKRMHERGYKSTEDYEKEKVYYEQRLKETQEWEDKEYAWRKNANFKLVDDEE